MKKQSLNVPFGIQNPYKKNPQTTPPDEIYENCLSEKVQHQLKKHFFDHEQFLKFYKQYEYQPAFRRAMRIMVQIGTIESCLRGKYFLTNGDVVHLNQKKMLQSAKSTKMYNFKKIESKNTGGKLKTTIIVVEGDCLETGLYLKNKKQLNPAVLIMASSNHPGVH
jgi:hypothetical protein